MSENHKNKYKADNDDILRHVCEQTLRKNFYEYSHRGAGVPCMKNLISGDERG